MVILSKMKDYYDHVVQTMGIDELVVYDRRDCFPIDPQKGYIGNTNIEIWFKREPIYNDRKRNSIKRWSTSKALDYEKHEEETKHLSGSKRFKSDYEDILEGQVYYFVLEIGYHHYFFEVERYLDDDDNTKAVLNYWFVKKQDIDKKDKISKAPMCICPCTYEKHHWLFNSTDRFTITDRQLEQAIDNPILFRTYIPKFIDPLEVWNDLYEYISSLRDKEFIDSRTNEQHIESNGFDKKISFRHRKKK